MDLFERLQEAIAFPTAELSVEQINISPGGITMVIPNRKWSVADSTGTPLSHLYRYTNSLNGAMQSGEDNGKSITVAQRVKIALVIS